MMLHIIRLKYPSVSRYPSLCQRRGFTGRCCDALHLLQRIWHIFSRVGGLFRKRDLSHNLTKKNKWISFFFCISEAGDYAKQKRKKLNQKGERVIESNMYFSLHAVGHTAGMWKNEVIRVLCEGILARSKWSSLRRWVGERGILRLTHYRARK